MAKILKNVFLLGLFFVPCFVWAADLFLSPSSGSYEVGERISVRVLVSGDEPLNAISGVVSFSPSYFTIEAVSKNASVLNFWVTEPSFSKTGGTARFEGVALSGFTGVSGTIVTVTLRALKVGKGVITFQSGQILANDGQGTDITGSLSGASFTIVEPREKPKLEPKVEPVIVPEVPQPVPTLYAPVIIRGSEHGYPAIIGTSQYPKAQVLLTFLSEGGSKIFITGVADDKGDFTLGVPRSLKRGYYSVTAVMVEPNGTNSLASESLLLMVGSIFSDIGWEFWLFVILLLLIIIYLIIRTHIHFKRDRNTRKVNSTELKQAREVVHKSFEVLQEDIDIQDKEKLSAQSRRSIATLQKDLIDAEKMIDKEIKDIEST